MVGDRDSEHRVYMAIKDPSLLPFLALSFPLLS